MTRRPRVQISEFLLLLLWATALLHIVWPDPLLAKISGGLLILYVAMVLPRIRRQLRILCGLLALTALALGGWLEGWSALWKGVERAVIFAAFFGTLTVLRATADRRPEVARARQLVNRLRAEERDSGFMIGSNVLGSVLIVGVMAVFAPISGTAAPYEVRKAAAEACQRGMCLACLWSPFWVAMALATEYLPNVPLWQIMALGLLIMPAGLMIAQVLYTPDVGIAGLRRALAALMPVLPPVAIVAAAILTLNGLTPLTTLQSLVIGIPLLCLAALIHQGAHHLRPALVQARVGIGAVRGEVVLMSCALALGQVLELALTVGGAGEEVASLALPSWLIIAMIPAIMTCLGFIGVHQVVTATVALVLFGTFDFGIAPLVLMEATLLGWAFASMTGISAVSVASAATMFGVPLEVVAFGSNLKFVAVFGAVAIVLLVLTNLVVA